MKRVFLTIIVAVFMTSCYKSELTNTTHPEMGKVTVDIELPIDFAPGTDGYTIIFNGMTTSTMDDSVALDATVEPGEYYIYVYNNVASVSIEDKSATDGIIIATSELDGADTKSLADHICFGMQRVVVNADAVVISSVSMFQISRDINFNLQITDGDPNRIISITASLSGITTQWECVGDTPWGTPANIVPTLTQGASIVKSTIDNDYISGSIRVFGVNGTQQILTIELGYDDGKTQKIVSDISDQLTNANINKTTAITLSGDINTPVEAGQEGTITNWEQINGGSQTVN